MIKRRFSRTLPILAALMTAAALSSTTAASAVPAPHAKRDTVLHAFELSDGLDPDADLVSDGKGDFYGTTAGGGESSSGTIFKIAPDGTFSSLYAFSGESTPIGSLVLGDNGNLFGTTLNGGSGYDGTVYRLSPDGTLTVLHAFAYGYDGYYPNGGLVAVGDLLYGTTEGGGKGKHCGLKFGCGLIFSISHKGKSEKTVFAFQGGSDGAFPVAGLTKDASGNLYGTTSAGGQSCPYQQTGCGTVFKLAPDGTETVLHAFGDGSDGGSPFAGVAVDSQGNVYGTALYGGGSGCVNENGCGTVFKIAADGTFSVLHAFGGGSDGALPESGVLVSPDGSVYGTTPSGGTSRCSGNGCGTVFKIAPDGTETILYAFHGKSDGLAPFGGLTAYEGELYGTTGYGGLRSKSCNHPPGCGTVFAIKR